MGSVGASKGNASSGFRTEDEFERQLTDFNDPRLQQYSNAYDEVNQYTQNLRNNMQRSIAEDGYGDFTDTLLQSEKNIAQQQLDNMPEYKTPAQLGEYKALQERLDIIQELRKQKGAKGRGRAAFEVPIV